MVERCWDPGGSAAWLPGCATSVLSAPATRGRPAPLLSAQSWHSGLWHLLAHTVSEDHAAQDMETVTHVPYIDTNEIR